MKALHSSGSTSHAVAHRPGQPREPTDYSRAGRVGAAPVGLRLAELLGDIRGPHRTRELAGMNENSRFDAFLGPADLSLNADWLDVFISVARDGFFLSQLGVKSLTPSWMAVRDGFFLNQLGVKSLTPSWMEVRDEAKTEPNNLTEITSRAKPVS
jgi:hypothetical protein